MATDSQCFSVSTKQSVGSVITRCSGNRPELSEIYVVGRGREDYRDLESRSRKKGNVRFSLKIFQISKCTD